MTENHKNSVIAFLQWWQQGLALLWRTVKPQPQVLGFWSSQWRLLPKDEVIDLGALVTQEVYLRVPAENTIRTQIPASKRAETLAEVATQLLPFSSEEIYFASGADKAQLFAIPKADVQAEMSALAAAGHKVTGVAFQDDSEFYICATEDQAPEKTKSPIKLVASVFFAGLLIAAVATAVAWRWQSQQQQKLVEAIDDLSVNRLNLSKPIVGPIVGKELLQQLSALLNRDAVAVSTSLNALLKALPVDSEVQQIILTESELVVDARARNAAELKAALENQDAFVSSEFVTAISTDTKADSERFRLKASLNSDLRANAEELR